MTNKTYGTMYYVDDMKKAVAYYTGKLGFKPAYTDDSWTEFPVGDHRICLHAKRAGETYGGNGILIFEIDGIKGLFEKMKGDGLNPFGLHEVHPQAWTFHAKDVSGNELSFFGKP